MKVTKPQIIIHAFALTHAVVSLVCQLGGIGDGLLHLRGQKQLPHKEGRKALRNRQYDGQPREGSEPG